MKPDLGKSALTKLTLLLVIARFNCGIEPSVRAGSDWPRFRGPNGTGAAPDARPPLKWSDSENLRWKLALPGPGTSSPIIFGDRLFLTCYSGYGIAGGGGQQDLKRHLVCVRAGDGKILWTSTVAAELPEDSYNGFLTEHGYASSTPVTDGERVFAFFGKSGIYAFDFSGKELWHVNVGHESSNRRWGSGASPILYRDLVIVNAAEESRTIYAFDKKTGKQAWKTEAGGLELCFSTPILVPRGETAQDLVLAVPDELWGLNPDNGKLRWFVSSGLPGNLAPSVVAGDGMVYAFGGFPQIGSVAVRTGGKDDVTRTHVLWSGHTSTYVPTPLLHDGHLYFASDQGMAVCLDAKTGEVVYRERLPVTNVTGRESKPFYASAVLANDRIYLTSRRSGVFVVPATPKFEILATNRFAGDSSQFNATPALSAGKMFLRSDKFLYCVEETSKVAEVETGN
jgi:outer membrane protein assembly factor BamB